jgi:thiol-disulfide isomerase/thioredoxin
MKKIKSANIFPDNLSLLIPFFLIFISFSLRANELRDYNLYENLFKTLEMETFEHKKIKLTDISTPYVVVNFWASWCIPCLSEMPSLIKMADKYPNSDLSVVAVNIDEDEQIKNIIKAQKKLKIPKSFIIVIDKKTKIADEFKFSEIPVTVIFKKGKVVFFSNGPVDFLSIKF